MLFFSVRAFPHKNMTWRGPSAHKAIRRRTSQVSFFSFFLSFFTLIGICTLHPALASVSSFFFLLFFYTLSCLQARAPNASSHPPSASVSSFLCLCFLFILIRVCTHARNASAHRIHHQPQWVLFFVYNSSMSACTHAIRLHMRVLAHVEVQPPQYEPLPVLTTLMHP